jgi:benzodiazapine receptor
MTTYIPQLTLPQTVFDNPALSILLPIALGTAVGFSVRRSRPPFPVPYIPYASSLAILTPLLITQPASRTKTTYRKIRNPPFYPPPGVFGPVWTLLYGLMGYAAYRAVHIGTSPLSLTSTIRDAKAGATLYTVQLGLNLLWMPLFFGLNRPIAATVDIVALLGLNGYLTYLWGGVDSVAGWCLVPYLAWLSFATYLSAGATWLNDGDLRPKEEKEL